MVEALPRPPRRRRPPVPAPPAEPAAPPTAEQLLEKVAELAEVLGVHSLPVHGERPVPAGLGSAPHQVLPAAAVLTEVEYLVILRTPLGIVEDLVRLVDLLEALFGLGLPAVHVRMVLARELPEGLADCLLVGAPLDPKNLVVVFELHDPERAPRIRPNRAPRCSLPSALRCLVPPPP